MKEIKIWIDYNNFVQNNSGRYFEAWVTEVTAFKDYVLRQKKNRWYKPEEEKIYILDMGDFDLFADRYFPLILEWLSKRGNKYKLHFHGMSQHCIEVYRDIANTFCDDWEEI